MNDKNNFRIFCWVDNNVVKFVSNVHRGTKDETVEKARRRPRTNQLNKVGVEEVWGDQPRVNIQIPGIVDDYNHWMLGVDVADQLISSYRPKIRCRRTWMPLFLHCLDVLRVNCYILYRETSRKEPTIENTKILGHKQFVIELINCLIVRGNRKKKELSTARTITTRTVQQETDLIHRAGAGEDSRYFMKRQNPSLDIFDCVRLQHGIHAMKKVEKTKLKHCCYCRFLFVKAKAENLPEPKMKKTITQCSFCKVHLCPDHFHIFHEA